MSDERLFIDTVFVEALLNQRDRYHQTAKFLLNRVRVAKETWITEAVLTEVGNALSASDRLGAERFIRQCYRLANMTVVAVDPQLFDRALVLYRSRLDKTWGLTDCISFVIMKQQGLTDAVTADRHFLQAGYRALTLEIGIL